MTLEEIWKWLTSLPFIGKIARYLSVLFGINEVIEKVTGGKINPFRMLIDLISNKRAKILRNGRAKYNAILATPEFLDWSIKIIKIIYPRTELIKILDFEYPVVCIPSSEYFKYPFEKLINKSNLETKIPAYTIDNPVQKSYKRLLGDTIKRPLLKGYMLDEYDFNDNKEIISLSARVGTYEQNVYTSHIIEYELFLLYQKQPDNLFRLSSKEILEHLPLLKSIHKNLPVDSIVKSGANRSSLLAVQGLIVFKNYEDNEYKVLVIKRSEDVAAKPGFFQFIPAGGFEIFQNDESDYILKKNYSLKLAFFREFLEEVYGIPEFVHNEKGTPEEDILKHPKVVEILDMLKKQEAHFEFLGSTVDMIGLRHELSFLLRIDNVNFSKNSFNPNHESKTIHIYDLTEISTDIDKEKLNQASAGLLYLASKHPLFKEICQVSFQ